MYKTTIAYDIEGKNEYDDNLYDAGDEVNVIAKLLQRITIGDPSYEGVTFDGAAAFVVMENLTKDHSFKVESVQLINANIDDMKDVPIIGEVIGNWDEVAKKELVNFKKYGWAGIYE